MTIGRGLSAPCPLKSAAAPLPIAVLGGLGPRGDQLQIAWTQQVVETVLQLAADFKAYLVRLQIDAAAVIQDNCELQLTRARVGTDDLFDRVEGALAVLALEDPHDDAGRVPRVELVEWNQLVH